MIRFGPLIFCTMRYERSFGSYAEASYFAKTLARSSERSVTVSRRDREWIAQWTVLLDGTENLTRHHAEQTQGAGNDDDESLEDYEEEPEEEYQEYWVGEEDYDDYYDHEMEMASLREELLDDQDGWARSDEEGWYYDD